MHFLSEDTIVAPATVVGTGALTLLRMSGPEAIPIAEAVVKVNGPKLSESKGYTLHYGQVFKADGSPLDDVLVSVFRAPRSYTGEDSVEISCHASSYIADELLQLLCGAGARFAQPGEFTRRAFLNGKMDLSQAEAVADVIASATEASHRVASHQLRGGVSRELQQMRTELLEMSSLLELELDFSEEDVEFADRSALRALLDRILGRIKKLTDSFRLGNAVRNGVPVALVGTVNAGKSTLLNTMLGDERALVSDVAGTTRDTVEEVVNLGGIAFRLIDTAGIRETSETVEKMGIERSFRSLADADFVVFVLDSTRPFSENLSLLESLSDKLDGVFQQSVIWLNKADLLSENDINNAVTSLNNFVLSIEKQIDIFSGSAKSEKDVKRLLEWLVEREKERIPQADATLITNRRHYDCLLGATENLERLRSGLDTSLPTDLLAEELRLALSHLGQITGEITSADTLNEIFSRHCIGK